MAIKIVRNNEGNCINFYGSSNPTYWNACLSGEVDAVDNTLVSVRNDIKTAESGITQYEFFRIPYTEFVDEDNNTFADAQAAADYITLKGNVIVGTGVTYLGVWDAATNTPDITTDVSGYNAGDFYKTIAQGTHDLGSGDEDFINGDEVIFNGTTWDRKPYAGALIEYDSTGILLNNNAAVYADAAPGLEDPLEIDEGWYFTNDEAGKKINWYYLGNQNSAYEITKATLLNGWARIKFIKNEYVFFSLYTTPLGDGYDVFWFRSRYTYANGDFSGVVENQEVIVYWGEEPTEHPSLARVQLSLDPVSSMISTAPDVSNDSIFTMALSTDSGSAVDSVEFIAKELGFKNGQYTQSYMLEAKLETSVVNDDSYKDLNGIAVDFSLDNTSTSIMMDNGFSFGVNTIKAQANADGTIHITSYLGDKEEFHTLLHTDVSIQGVAASGGLNDVVNALNELFTVGAFESVVISDPYSTMIADVAGVDTTYSLEGNAIDPLGTDIAASTASGYNNAGLKTVETINQAGEYFTFDIRVEGIIGMGLIANDINDVNGNTTYGAPTSFCNGPNSGHYGYQFSHWFHPSPNGPWTNYGANTGYIMSAGWSSATSGFRYSPEGQDWLDGNPVKMRVGIDTNAFISIDYYDVSESEWIVIARTNYPAQEGVEYHLGIKFGDTNVRLASVPKIHELEELAPVMNFRYIESPDGVYNYPLFTTEEEAQYYDLNHDGVIGTGTSSTMVFPDDPTNTVWHVPTTGYIDDATVAPTSALSFIGNAINWTIITSLTNTDLIPTPFTDSSITVDELSSVNVQVHPSGATFVTSIGSIPSFSLHGEFLQGTAPEVTGDNVTNPSDITTVTVYRTNAYGTSQGTLTINITNLTAPVITPVTGFTHNATSTALIDADTMDDGSVVEIDEQLENYQRLIIDGAYIEANVLPALQQAGDKYIMGALNVAADVSSVEESDFDFAFIWEYVSASSHKYRVVRDGVEQASMTIASMTSAYYDYAIEVNTSDVWMIACNVNAINTEPSPEYGGSFSNAHEILGFDGSTPLTISVAYIGSGSADFGTSDMTEIVVPAPNNWIQVSHHGSDLYFDGSTTMPTLQAGYTYRFLQGELEYADQYTSTHVVSSDVIRFTADGGSTEYTTGISRVGTPGSSNTFGASTSYIEFSVPSDVPSLEWYTDHTGTGTLNTVTTSGSTATANLTPWTKALDFSGSNEHLKQVSQSTLINALRMGGKSVTVPANTDSTKTADDSNSSPWATAIVFRPDGISSNQHIWNSGEGTSTGSDNIYLRLSASGQLYFGWGREGTGYNEKQLATVLAGQWFGVYIAHKGERLNASNATAANLDAAFDIRVARPNDLSNDVGADQYLVTPSGYWTSTGARMDRAVTGDFTIGGRGSNRSFHGKVASMVVTTLRSNFAMPTDTEIKLMITDPKKWEDDYRVGQFVRWAHSTSITTYNPSNFTYGYGNTQIWLMGDGTSDSYANGIRNDVYPNDQNYTKMQLNSMVSNDIENVNINGLT